MSDKFYPWPAQPRTASELLDQALSAHDPEEFIKSLSADEISLLASEVERVVNLFASIFNHIIGPALSIAAENLKNMLEQFGEIMLNEEQNNEN